MHVHCDRLSDMDEVEECRTASSQTELASSSYGCSSWALSYADLSDDDGYDVIVDDSDDSTDVFDDSFARREVTDVLMILMQKLRNNEWMNENEYQFLSVMLHALLVGWLVGW